MRRARESPAHFVSGTDAKAPRIFLELAGDRAPAVVEAHILVGLAIGFVLEQGDRLVRRLAVPSVGEGNYRRERKRVAAFAHVVGPIAGPERAGPDELLPLADLEHAAWNAV